MLPRVMPANLVKKAKILEVQFPGRMALIFSPGGFASPRGLPYVLDNGRFSVWSKGREWCKKSYWKLLDRISSVPYPPEWILVPDVVMDCKATFEEWKRYHPILSKLGHPLALAVQDGMTLESVKTLYPSPQVIFVGGSTNWKWRTLEVWTRNFPRVHVGRINTLSLLWRVHRAGAESSDGSGWWHKKQSEQLLTYLDRSSKGLSEDIFRRFW